MKLHRIRLEQVRQFRRPFELTDLQPGLNLFTGPNEAGKSTIVRAIRAAFFERYRSTSVEDLLPRGDTAVTPTIEMDFEIAGQQFQLRKCFLNKRRCELKVASHPRDGEEAEQYLAEILGFEFSGRGASKPEHWGIPGLLWIEQGSGQEIAESVGNATSHLRRALEQSVGAVASSQGDAVMAQIRAQRDELLTAAARPRNAYSQANTQHDELKEQAAVLDLRIAEYHQQVDELETLLREDAADSLARPWVAFRAQMQVAQEQLDAVEHLSEKVTTDQQTLAQVKDRQKLIDDQLQTLDTQEQDLAIRAQALQRGQTALETAQQAESAWQAAKVSAKTGYQNASDALALSRQEDLRKSLQVRLADAARRIEILQQTVAKAAAAHSDLETLEVSERASSLEKSVIEKLRSQQNSINELRIRRDVASTRLRYALLSDASIDIAAETVSGQGERLLTSDTRLEIPGIGQLEISPGGADLAELARKEQEFQDEHATLLQQHGLESLAAAEARLLEHQDIKVQVGLAKNSLASLAPAGLEALRVELQDLQAQDSQLSEQLLQLPAPPEPECQPLTQCQSALDAARLHLDAVSQEAAQAQLQLVSAQSQAENAQREHIAVITLLNHPQRQQKKLEAAQSVLRAKAEVLALETTISTNRSQIDAARPDILAQDVERLRRSAEVSEKQFRERQNAISLLRIRLEDAGVQGLEEQRSELAAQLEGAGRRVRELAARAHALDLLVNLMESRRADLVRKLQAPLQKHMDHYLQLLFAQGKLEIGEDLGLGLLTRGNESTQFGNLSFGAREQLGVIGRLAYADLLKAAGRPTLIIMDDALVHSDSQRLEQMKRVVFDASQRHQILVFTCHPMAWQNVGASPRPIARPV
jgi:energy-coupling factor transporter ATP-binding protein EcfA2